MLVDPILNEDWEKVCGPLHEMMDKPNGIARYNGLHGHCMRAKSLCIVDDINSILGRLTAYEKQLMNRF